MKQVLAQGKKYSGKYIAVKNFNEPRVVGYGDTPQEAHQKAVRKGCQGPVIAYVPEKAMAHIY